jgi:hypothetical protein
MCGGGTEDGIGCVIWDFGFGGMGSKGYTVSSFEAAMSVELDATNTFGVTLWVMRVRYFVVVVVKVRISYLSFDTSMATDHISLERRCFDSIRTSRVFNIVFSFDTMYLYGPWLCSKSLRDDSTTRM